MELTDFSTLTFDCYGTLIDWEAGILAALGPWSARHGLGLDDAALLDAFARAERHQQGAAPGMLYPAVLENVLAAIGAEAVEPLIEAYKKSDKFYGGVGYGGDLLV